MMLKYPDTIILSFPIDLVNLHQHMLAISFDLPEEADMTAFKHIMFDWMPHGHEPVVFERPHFDFHLYYTTEA